VEPTPTSTLLACHSWADFHREVRPFSNKLTGDCFELLTREFLLLDARYDFKHIWNTRGEVPKELLKKLNLFGRDVTGIDFVAETQAGKYWAIQCKYHHDAGTLTREEATGLIAGRNRARGQFELGLICTTANGRSAHLTEEPDIEYLMGDVWRGLDSEFFDRLHAHLRGAEPPPPALKHPRPHQLAAIESVRRHFAKEARGKVVMPCATGKSLVGFWCAEDLQARSVVIAVPNLSLVRQLLKDWTEQSVARGRRPRWIVVCSDDSVADQVAARDLGVKVDTDPTEVAEWFRANRDAALSVVFTTYQSGRVLAAATRQADASFDLGIFDEAHRTAGRQGGAFAHLLSDDNVRINKRIFMTATPRIYGGKDRDDVVSMDDASVYGTEAFQMTFLAAMEQGIIPNLTTVVVAVSGKEVQKILSDRRFVRLQAKDEDTVIRVEDLVSALAVRKAMKSYGIRRTLAFHGSRKRCRLARNVQQLVGELLPEYGSLDVLNVDGEMTAGERDVELRAFEASEHALMTNVRVFVEGVDCPTMDAVVFSDPRQSVIDIVQGVGRALRAAPGKTKGYAIIPVSIEDDGTLSDEAYAEIVRVACALGSENEVVLDYFSAIAQDKPWAGRHVFEVLDVDTGLSVDLGQVNRAIAVRIYERISWRVTIGDAHALATERGFKFLSPAFMGVHRKHRWQCEEGHEWEAAYVYIRGGTGCPYCAGKAPKTVEDAQALAKTRGLEFLSLEFAGVGRKYPWQCSKGHTWEATYGNVLQGHGCPHCAGLARKTIEDARALSRTRGFKFLSSEFAGALRKYLWQCSKGHKWEAKYNSIQQGLGCPHCAGLARKTIDDARALSRTKGFKFLSPTFAGVHRKNLWRCQEGHEWEASYGSIRGGTGCPYCAGKARKTIKDARSLAKSRGFKFLSVEFTTTQKKYLWQCLRGHRWEAEYSSIQQGRGCPNCAGKASKTVEDAQALAEGRGFEFLSEKFMRTKDKYLWQCSEAHKFEATYSNVQQGQGCPHCARARRSGKPLEGHIKKPTPKPTAKPRPSPPKPARSQSRVTIVGNRLSLR
jgi:superfamily II DNA or RNA helicase